MNFLLYKFVKLDLINFRIKLFNIKIVSYCEYLNLIKIKLNLIFIYLVVMYIFYIML